MGVEELEGIRKRQMLRSIIESNRLADMIAKEFEYVGLETPLYDVLAKMKSMDLHEIPVLDGNNLAGVVSFGNLLRRGTLPMNTKARSVMETPPDMDIASKITEVAEKMVATGYRQLPILSGKKIAGIISRKDIVKIVPKIKDLRNLKVGDVMTTDVYTIGGDDPLVDAVEAMKGMDIRTLPVVDNEGRLAGIVGVKDIVKYNWREKQKQTVGEITGNSAPVTIKVSSMAVDLPFTTTPGSSLGESANLMLDKGISTLPVLDEGRLVGIITSYDMVELIASLREREMVYVQITGLEEEDAHELEVMEKEIQSGLAKVAKISWPMLFTVHVSKYHQEGNSAKYSLSARLTTEHKIYGAKAYEWNLMKATMQLMERMERFVTEHKEERVDKRKGRR